MKRRSIHNDPIATNERDRGLVVPIRIFLNAVDPAPAPDATEAGHEPVRKPGAR
jgi:hypothetical protein